MPWKGRQKGATNLESAAQAGPYDAGWALLHWVQRRKRRVATRARDECPYLSVAPPTRGNACVARRVGVDAASWAPGIASGNAAR